MTDLRDHLFFPDPMFEELREKNEGFQFCYVNLFYRESVDGEIVNLNTDEQADYYESDLLVKVTFMADEGKISRYFEDSSAEFVEDTYSKVLAQLGSLGWSIVKIFFDDDDDMEVYLQRQVRLTL